MHCVGTLFPDSIYEEETDWTNNEDLNWSDHFFLEVRG